MAFSPLCPNIGESFQIYPHLMNFSHALLVRKWQMDFFGRSHGLPGSGWPLKCVIHRSLCPHDAQQHVHWQRPGVNLLLIKAWDKPLL